MATPSSRRTWTRRGYTTEDVAAAALSVLDRAGRDGLSVRAVAGELEIAPNALYSYVPDRAALDRLVIETVLAGAADVGPSPDPRQSIRNLSRAVHLALSAHPGAASLAASAPMDGPAALAIGERLLRDLSAAGLDPTSAARGVYMLIVHVVGSAILAAAEIGGAGSLPDEQEWVAARATGFASLDEHAWPTTHQAAPVMATWVTREQFEWGLERLLDGLGVAPEAL